ncbi:polymer-forming cytoskeletal protein [Campylobacter sp. RM12327]|uniref:bactofilin family protein n=1 Tax=Campylobacter sputorum TaxID=206 RepID=UPI000B7924EE|nr:MULTISPECIES: polymer-forming cytoskeletal protein [Campylobacter]ASM39954.1 bactofilin domain protein [Campylobacter sputorum]MBE7357605.1 polymer-forming cytoskeletal protein [Campylobacter sp. RM11302]MBF6669251.1 polymer-forming cytoskeletal protein [Campylobacter sp. RM12327]MBF6674520.1 polymer-forming cytoskeletal protein [Campylobacter sp. RM13538]MBF6675473.1 polymer-forming cytoskeletal protein [Campylobacter sp. RM12321]
MAIFNKGNNQLATETTVISTGAKLKGEFNFESMLHVDGLLDGDILSNSVVVIGNQGHIKGTLKAKKLIVSGVFSGEVDCESVQILAGGSINGNVISEEFIIEAKAIFEGKSSVRKVAEENTGQLDILIQKDDE